MTLDMDIEVISKWELTETNCFQDSTGSQSKEGQQKLNRQADQRQKLTKGPGVLKKIIGVTVIYLIVIPQCVLSNYYIICAVLGTGNIIEKWDGVTGLLTANRSGGQGRSNSITYKNIPCWREKVVNLVLDSLCLGYL